jgi:hypothetical protein
MNVLGRFTVLVAGVAGLGLVAAKAPDPVRTREVARIRSHFDSVAGELRARNVSALTPAARSERLALISEVERYRDAGAFPHNYDFPGELVPYFVDRKTGVRCAVANLLEKTGRGDIVERVRVANNNVRVPQLSGDTAFNHWLDDHGLTLAEAARIQVPYGTVRTSTEMRNDVIFGFAALGAMGGSVVTGLWNMAGNGDGQHSKLAKTGIVFGVASGLLGARMLTGRDVPAAFGQSAIVLGIASTGFGVRSLHHRSMLAQQDSARARAVAQAMLEPTVDARGSAGARLGLSIGF